MVDSHTVTGSSHFTVSISGGEWVPAEHVLCTVSRHPTFPLCHCQLLRKAGFSSRHTKRYLPASNHHLSTRRTGWGQHPCDAAACSSCGLDRSKCKGRSSQTFPPLPTQWPSCSAPQSNIAPTNFVGICYHFQIPRRPQWLKSKNYTVDTWNAQQMLHGNLKCCHQLGKALLTGSSTTKQIRLSPKMLKCLCICLQLL